MSTALAEDLAIRFAKTERLNLASSGKRFVCRFIEPGLISYRDVKGGVDLIRKETIDLCLESMKGAALTIDHPSKEVILSKNFADVSHGTIDKVGYDAESGWFTCEGTVETDAARRRIMDGDGVSCGFSVVERANGGKWHNLPYDQEDTRIEFHHLAIVPPNKQARFEDADIRLNSTTKAMSFVKHIKKLLTGGKSEETARDIDLSTTIDVGDGKTATLKELLDAERANAIHVVSGEDYIEHDGMRYNCAELVANYKANCMRANAAEEQKKKDEVARIERENAAKKEAEDKVAKEKADKEMADKKAAQERENAKVRGQDAFRTLHGAASQGQVSEVPDYSLGMSGSLDDQVALGRERYGKPVAQRSATMAGKN